MARRVHAWRAQYEEVFTMRRVPTRTRLFAQGATITFSEKYEEGILHLLDVMLVVTMQVANFTI